MAPDLARKMLDVMSATPTISATTIIVEERVIRELHDLIQIQVSKRNQS